ncbi:hypothetical protein HYX04_05510 [Candidatus Woesearchaeota archaeon]|nr:hypothetical protein [Candidatus Woesearchaeota archaeon]
MPEVRFSTPNNLDKLISDTAESLGVDKSDYLRSLILKDLRKHHKRKNA